MPGAPILRQPREPPLTPPLDQTIGANVLVRPTWPLQTVLLEPMIVGHGLRRPSWLCWRPRQSLAARPARPAFSSGPLAAGRSESPVPEVPDSTARSVRSLPNRRFEDLPEAPG